MIDLPFISVIVPVRNGESTVRKCIESLLCQDYPRYRYEIIIVDNGSNDRTSAIVRSFPVRYLEEKKIKTSYAARNKGIKEAKGSIIAFTDSDCIASVDWLTKGLEGFSDASVGCVAGGIEGYRPRNYVEEYLCKRKVISQDTGSADLPFSYAKTANAFYAKSVFDRVGLFEEKWISGGDADLGFRMRLESGHGIKFLHQALVFHRHRSDLSSMFKQGVKWGIGYSLLCKKYRDKIHKRKIRQVIWIFWRLFQISVKLIPFCFREKENMPIDKREEYLDYISFMGWEIGRIAGSVRYLAFCV